MAEKKKSLTKREKRYLASIIVGFVLAVLFTILALTTGSDYNQTGYIAAAVATALVGVVSIFLFFLHKEKK